MGLDPFALLGLDNPVAPPEPPLAGTQPTQKVAPRMVIRPPPGMASSEDGATPPPDHEASALAEKTSTEDPFALLGLPQPDQSKTEPAPDVAPKALTQPPIAGESAATRWARGLSLPERFLGSTAATLEGIPRGIVGDAAVDNVNAALGMIPGMFYGQPAGSAKPNMPLGTLEDIRQNMPSNGFRLMGPGDAFSQAKAISQAEHKQMGDAFPLASMAGEAGGALTTGIAAAPALAYKAPMAAATVMPKIAAAGSYLARNAAFGGAASALAGGDPMTGAAIGGGAAATLPAVAAPFKALGKLAPIFSNAAQQRSVGRTLGKFIKPGDIETSPVGPLSLAQATNNAEIAARGDLAPSYNATTNARLLADQQAAAAEHVAKIGAPSTEADAADILVRSIRSGRKLAAGEEDRLWTVPELAQRVITAGPVNRSVKKAVDAMEPALKAAMSPQLQAIVSRLNRVSGGASSQEISAAVKAAGRPGPGAGMYFPGPPTKPPGIPSGSGRTTVRDLNGIRSDLEHIARNSLDGAERKQARALSDAFMTGMDAVPELQAGQHGAQDVFNAYTKARGYTREMRTMFNDPQLRQVMRKIEGVYQKDPVEGARLFFNFSNGNPEGPKSLAQLADFLDTLHMQAGSGAVATDLRDSARSYVASALSEASRLGAGKNFNPKLMQEFLGKNADWMVSSGLFERPQIEAARALMGYTEMLRRPEQLLRQVNSATQPRQARDKTFIDQIMSPWTRRIAETVMTLGAAESHGGIGAGAALMASQAFEHSVASAENAMRTVMAGVLLDSQAAKGLLMNPRNEGFLSQQTKELIRNLRLATGSEIAPRMPAPELGSPQKTEKVKP